jgi:hypothetical protein
VRVNQIAGLYSLSLNGLHTLDVKITMLSSALINVADALIVGASSTYNTFREQTTAMPLWQTCYWTH